jgi:hypothetical protein
MSEKAMALFDLTCETTEHTVDDDCGCEEVWTQRSCDDDACWITVGGRDEGMWGGKELNHDQAEAWVGELNAAHEAGCPYKAEMGAAMDRSAQHYGSVIEALKTERDELRAKLAECEKYRRSTLVRLEFNKAAVRVFRKRNAEGEARLADLEALLRYWRPLIREAIGLNPEEQKLWDRLIGPETGND